MRVSWFSAMLAFVLAALLVASVAAVEPAALQKTGIGKRPGRPVSTAPVQEQQLTDEEALGKAMLTPTDGVKLIEYLQMRTLTDTEQGRITTIIKRFGADEFDERVKATEEIEAFGPAAIGPLKVAANDSDPEIAYRARLALKKVETVPHSAVAAAAIRAVVKLKPDGVAATLIGFLPLADDETVAELIRESLITLAVKDGKADPALLNALTDSSPIRRAAAYVALTQGGPAVERIRIKDAYPKVREAVLKDTDADTKFLGLWTLLLTTREKEYVTELIALIPTINRGRIWQLEDLLLQLAGTHPKDGRILKSPESLAKACAAWQTWWKEKGDKIDLVNLVYKPRVTGVTDIIEMDARFYGPGRIVSLGPDMKEKWRINGVNSPTDVKVAANGHVFVVESNNHLITERTTNGNILTRRNAYQQPVNINLLPDGGQIVVCRNNVFEFDKDGKQLWVFQRQNYDIMTGHRLPNGDTLVIINAGQQATGIRIDDKGKATGKTYTFGQIQDLQSMDVVGEDKVLICEWTKVAEYDLKTGKETWKHECSRPTSCQRLPNGNTLISLLNQNPNGQVIEVDPSGEIVWEFQGRDGLHAGRAYRR